LEASLQSDGLRLTANPSDRHGLMET